MAQPQYPTGVTTFRCTIGIPIGWDGMPNIKTTVEVAPSRTLVWSATGTRVIKFVNTFSANEGQEAEFTIPHVDQAGFIDPATMQAVTNWHYVVTVTWSHAQGGTEREIKTIQPITGQNLGDFDLIPASPVIEGELATIPAVVSVDGKVGVVETTKDISPIVIRDGVAQVLPGLIREGSGVDLIQESDGAVTIVVPFPLAAVQAAIGSSLQAANSTIQLAFDQSTGKTLISAVIPPGSGGGGGGGTNPMFLLTADPDGTNTPGATLGDWAFNERNGTLWHLGAA